MVNAVRLQSHDAPSLRSCFRMMPPWVCVQSQACSRNCSRVRSVFLDALFGQFSDHFGLGSYRRMVGAGHPKGVFAFHARAAHEYVLNSVVEHVAHVEHSSHVWRRDHDCVRFARVWHGAEKLMVSQNLYCRSSTSAGAYFVGSSFIYEMCF